MTSPTLAALRDRVRHRANISANDPRFPDNTVNRAISMAVNRVGHARPNGWWFDRYEKQYQNTTGADLDVMPLTLADRTRTVQKLGYVFVSLDGNYWVPVPERERTDAIRVSGGRTASGGIPWSWSVVRVSVDTGQRNQLGVVFDPPLPPLASVRVGLIVGAGVFTADSDPMVWLMPPMAGAVVELAAATIARQKRNTGPLTRRYRPSEQSIAQQAADGWLVALRAYYDRPYSGAGHGQLTR